MTKPRRLRWLGLLAVASAGLLSGCYYYPYGYYWWGYPTLLLMDGDTPPRRVIPIPRRPERCRPIRNNRLREPRNR